MAIRAADENGKARTTRKKKNPSFFLFKQETEDEENRYVKRQRKRE